MSIMKTTRVSMAAAVACFICLVVAWSAQAAGVESFTLGAGDVLEVSVWGDESLTRPNVIVRPDGKISFPLVGDLMAAGKTVEQLRKEFETRIGEYVSDAPVTIMLQELGSPQV